MGHAGALMQQQGVVIFLIRVPEQASILWALVKVGTLSLRRGTAHLDPLFSDASSSPQKLLRQQWSEVHWKPVPLSKFLKWGKEITPGGYEITEMWYFCRTRFCFEEIQVSRHGHGQRNILSLPFSQWHKTAGKPSSTMGNCRVLGVRILLWILPL